MYEYIIWVFMIIIVLNLLCVIFLCLIEYVAFVTLSILCDYYFISILQFLITAICTNCKHMICPCVIAIILEVYIVVYRLQMILIVIVIVSQCLINAFYT